VQAGNRDAAVNVRGPAGLIECQAPGKVPGFMWRIAGVLRSKQALAGFRIWH